ncbi:glycosyltransferase family 2 protein [Planotetraspora kaengkrachanensis]|uniref:glycosyltransferase family 2 protein n=1 Tax=Planotetraspora kaengkrachanensis TaxID=575193 RepID=UPI001940B36D|nr:glycosyltransferase family 2 protein [Planotetraspora kaengkrachanensis]
MIPRIRGNDYSVLTPPEIGAWTPDMRVSVVVPACDGQEKLDLTLAGLADQSYPAELVEVVVVGDGSEPPVRLPEIRHVNTRLIVCETRGLAGARDAGLRAARGDVVHWLDSDVVLDRVAIEAHMRWHHLAPYLAVTGDLRSTAASPAPPEVAMAGDRAKLFEPAEPDAWVVDLVERTDGLRSAAHDAFRLYTGESTSVDAMLLKAVGSADGGFVLGLDTAMGYRLSEAGAVFVPEPVATAYRLGSSTRRQETSGGRDGQESVPDHVPHHRSLRTHPNRQWLVPYVEVETDVTGASYEDVRTVVDAVLAGTIPDVSVVLRGPWDELEDERGTPPGDLALVRRHYAAEPRVRLGGRPGLAPFVLRLPSGWVPGEDGLAQLTDLMTERGLGLVSVFLAEQPDGIVAARMERTAAFARAEMLAEDGEDLDGVVTEIYGSMWVDPESYGLLPAVDATVPDDRRTTYRQQQERSVLQGEVARLTKELARLTKEAEGLKGKVTEAREEAKRWRTQAVQLRREVGALRKQVTALKQGHGLTRITRSGLRRIRSLLRDQSHGKQAGDGQE